MNKKGFAKILGILLFVTLSFVLLSKPIIPISEVYAASCPSGMSLEACLVYLQNEQAKLEGKKSNISKTLKEEEYQQLSLQEKIDYISNQITQTERLIKSLSVQIAASDIQIKLLEKSILEKEDSVSLLKQEIALLEETVNQRITESYKFSFVGPLEIFLDVKNISTALRRTKYLIATRSQDVYSLEEYSLKIGNLKEEEEQLAKERVEIQVKRNDIEEEKLSLAKESNTLETQRSEKNKLLAESQARESAYRNQLASISSKITDTENAVLQLMIELFNAGKLGNGTDVTKGSAIGVDGHTGCAFGTHLHFAVKKYDVYVDPLPLLNNGTLAYPMSGVYISQYYKSTHKAIDLVSTSAGYQGWNTYTVKYNVCSIVNNILDYRRYTLKLADWNKAYMRGEGPPVYAATSGKVYYYIEDTNRDGIKSPTDDRDGKYALVVSKDQKYKSFYVHLKF